MKLKLFFLSLIFLLSVSMLHANVIFPSMVMLEGMFNVFGWSLVLLSLIIEFVCLRQFINKTTRQLIALTLFINGVSAIFGTLGLFLYDFAISYVGFVYRMREFYEVFRVGPIPGAHIIYGLLFFVGSVLINVLIEGAAVKYFVPKVNVKDMVFWLLVANALSVGVGLGGSGMHWYLKGEPARRVRDA